MAVTTVIPTSARTLRHLTVLGLAVGSLAPLDALGVEVSAGITAGASYTDNVYLVASPGETDDVVYSLSPWITLTHLSPALDANIIYQYDWYEYSDLDTTSSFHVGSATFVGKALEEDLTIELGGRRRQVLSDPEDVIPGSRLPLAGGLTDRDELWVYPKFTRSFGRSLTFDTSYRLTEGRYDDPRFQDDTNQQAMLALDNYRAEQGLTWALRYDGRKTEYNLSPTWERQEALAELGWWLSGKTRIFASGGKESPWDEPTDSKMTESIWEAGLAYASGDKVSAELAYGERSFGSTIRAMLDYAFQSGNVAVTYDEIPTTIGFDTALRQSPALNPDGVSDFLTGSGIAESYIRERLALDVGIQLRRLDIGASVFSEDRNNRVRADGSTLSDQKQDGILATLGWQAGARTQVLFTGRVVDREFSNVNKSRFTGFRVDLNYRLGVRSTLTFAYDRAKQEPDDATPAGRAYESNIFSLLFTIGTGDGRRPQ